MLSIILGFITGLAGPALNFAGRLADLKIAQVNASSDIERAKVNQAIEEVHDKRAVLIAEAGSRIGSFLNGTMRFLLALGPLAIIWKLMIWDKVIGSFVGCSGEAGETVKCLIYNTDRLDMFQWLVITSVIGFYFVTTMRK